MSTVTDKTELSNTSKQKQQIKTLKIEGMHCASCVAAVERSLANVQGMSEASVNLATETARVAFDPKKTGYDDFVSAVDKAGYKVMAETGNGPEKGEDRKSVV